MIEISFAGWFQCRLATDPDPYDERRGVSGYVKAYVGEPDLDRVIRLKEPPFSRSYSQNVGVAVRSVNVNGESVDNHPLNGLPVNLLNEPVFEGRNGVVAEDGLEPIYPFDFQIGDEGFGLSRSVEPAHPDFPFDGLFAAGVEAGPEIAAMVSNSTGVDSLARVWERRLDKLKYDLLSANDQDKPGIQERIDFLSSSLANPSGPQRFFGAIMRYDYALNSHPQFYGDESNWELMNKESSWAIQFWCGAWDADSLNGFIQGSLVIPLKSDPPTFVGVGTMRRL